MRILASSPTSARNFLVTDVYGRGTHTSAGDAMVQTIFSGLHDLSRGINSTGAGEGLNGKPLGPRLTVAFAEFARIWDGVLDGTPGFEAFGYVSTDACVTDCSITFCGTDGMCSDPDHYFYYIPGCVYLLVLLGEGGYMRGALMYMTHIGIRVRRDTSSWWITLRRFLRAASGRELARWCGFSLCME